LWRIAADRFNFDKAVMMIAPLNIDKDAHGRRQQPDNTRRLGATGVAWTPGDFA
jgi:hypothetical protein